LGSSRDAKEVQESTQPYGRRVGGWDRPGEAYTARSFRGFGRNARFDDVGNLALLITISDGVPVLVTGARHSLRDHEPHFPPANR
jgi:hypothetical protein